MFDSVIPSQIRRCKYVFVLRRHNDNIFWKNFGQNASFYPDDTIIKASKFKAKASFEVCASFDLYLIKTISKRPRSLYFTLVAVQIWVVRHAYGIIHVVGVFRPQYIIRLGKA